MRNQSTSFDADGRNKTGRPTLSRPCTITPEDESEFQQAMEAYKQRSGRLFPTWSEILEVLTGLGYAKRIWRPIDATPAPALNQSLTANSANFRPMGEDSTTGLLCWFSWVETPADL
ncbi:hypothetical protein P12x_003314 [Tundrisphaera lichenicola]|uniref:hypothetical protein n=1 Tax=Tundrisphaera lichenicola TaxID=2029860 RepID=UPI003EB92E25